MNNRTPYKNCQKSPLVVSVSTVSASVFFYFFISARMDYGSLLTVIQNLVCRCLSSYSVDLKNWRHSATQFVTSRFVISTKVDILQYLILKCMVFYFSGTVLECTTPECLELDSAFRDDCLHKLIFFFYVLHVLKLVVLCHLSTEEWM